MMGTVSERHRMRTRPGRSVLSVEANCDPIIDPNHRATESSSTSQPSTSRRVRRKKKGSFLDALRRLLPRSAKRLLDARETGHDVAQLFLTSIGFLLTSGMLIRTLILSPLDSFEARSLKSAAAIQRYSMLYNQTYTRAVERLVPPDRNQWPEHEKRPFELGPVYGRNVVGICGLSVVVMEASLGYPKYDFGPGQPLWFALESLAAFSPDDACVILITSTCAMQAYLNEGSADAGEVDEDQVQEVIRQGIYENSLPLFRRLIESGRVRVTFLDHLKYNLNSCTSFSSSNNALFHRFFWDSEFEERDGDLVMIFQADSVLCYPLVAKPLAKYAFVGSVWPKANNPLDPESLEGPCREMPASWHSWLRPQRTYNKSRKRGQSAKVDPNEVGPAFLKEEFPQVCEQGRAPIGSGGLSLRSRRWMIKAIDVCPHVKYSGMNVDSDQRLFLCKVFDLVTEDYYFATVLQGIDAPLPSPYTATLFSSEAFWPDQILDEYPSSDVFDITPSGAADFTKQASSDWLGANRPAISFLDSDEQMVVPNAVHKVWWYHPEEMIRSAISDFCPFLPFVHTSNMYRYDEFIEERVEWKGIGT